jgi:glycosyltransferase involved in cell wall biosynthesis
MVIGATPTISERFEKNSIPTTTVNNFPILNEFTAIERESLVEGVCYAGYISELRGCLEMIGGAYQAQTKLFLAGSFESEALRKRCEVLPGWTSVVHAGELSRTDVVKLYSKSFAGLLLYHPAPNHVDAQPNKLFEYMASGLPVIASDFPLWRRLIEMHGCGLVVNPRDTSAIAKSISFLRDNPSTGWEMGRRGAEAVRTQYSWAAEEKRLLDAYMKVLPRRDR